MTTTEQIRQSEDTRRALARCKWCLGKIEMILIALIISAFLSIQW